MRVCFTGDVFLGGDLSGKPCGDLVNVDVFNRADKRIINLEQPISDTLFIEDKCTLYTGSVALQQLNDLKIDALNLANNHIQDKGLEAIGETVGHLNNSKIGHFGAGIDISTAAIPFSLTEEIVILSYCDFDKPYLRDVAVANSGTPGINPLRFSKIRHDLDSLPDKTKAILYFHWGMEHVWLPLADDIKLAKKLLEDERVITIIGMHPHRVQGVVKHAGKKAYMCLGNFIFPNFYIKPPVQIFYPTEEERELVKYTTKMYLPVYEPTYKKWRWVNRVSLVLDFCTETKEINHTFVVQNDESPHITDLKSIDLYFFRSLFRFLSLIYNLPTPVYSFFWVLHAFQVKLTWRLQIRWFHLKQLGLTRFLQKALNYISRKFK